MMHGYIPPERFLPYLSWTEIDELEDKANTVIVLPVGAIEQHGPHLPLSTDSIVATAVAEATVAEVGEELDVWLLPTLEYTKSNEHAWSPGTVWLSATTLLAVLDDLSPRRPPSASCSSTVTGATARSSA